MLLITHDLGLVAEYATGSMSWCRRFLKSATSASASGRAVLAQAACGA
jgi:hypothetical protein